jgi:hypothetical protein
MLSSFIDNRIIPNDSLYEYNQDRQSRILSIFKDLIIETYRDLKKNFYIYSEDKYDIIKKYHFIAMGVVYCKGKYHDKLELIFQMFKNENMFHDIDEFNSSVIRDDASKYVINNRNNQNNLDVFNRLHKGNKIKELGVKIVNVKMPRERKFNLNQYSDIEKKYSIIHRRKQSMGI